MRKLAVLIIIVLSFPTMFAQGLDYNLKGLTGVYVYLSDNQGVLNGALSQKLISDVRLKLLSAGVKTTDQESPVITFKVSYIKSALADQRILTEIFLQEDVKVLRGKDEILTGARTYTERYFFTSPLAEMESAVYNSFIDNLFVHFIDQYLKDNSK